MVCGEFSGAVCVPVPCTVGWSVSVLSLYCVCRNSMCSCTMHCWMVCFSAVTVLCLQEQYVFLHRALLDCLFQCCHCTVFAGTVCVLAQCTVGWSVSVLSLYCVCRNSMCSCTGHCWIVCFSAVTVLCLQEQYVFLHHALLDGLFQCCHCTVFAGTVCVLAQCTVGWSVSVLSLYCVCRNSMCSCTGHCWIVCFSAVTVLCLQEQYVFLHHALLDGLQTGHLAYPVSQYPAVYKRLCVDDAHMAELKKQFQVILVTVVTKRPLSTSIVYIKTCLSRQLSITHTFESPELLAVSLCCPLTAHIGHLANLDNRQGIWTHLFIVTLLLADRSKCIDNPTSQSN